MKTNKIKSYELNVEESRNDYLWETEEEDLDLMAATYQKIVDHYQNQGVEFWYEIDKDAPMNEAVCYISESAESFQYELDNGHAGMPGNAGFLIAEIEAMID